jgi:hypothetical protein
VDELGIIELVAKKTSDTSVITGDTIAIGRRHNIASENWIFDRGGGGKQHADRLRANGFRPRTVGFGEAPSEEVKRSIVRSPYQQRVDTREDRYAYKNKRCEMFGETSNLFDPNFNPRGFGVPGHYRELIRQLSLFPRKYDGEGRMVLPSKNRASADSTVLTLTDIMGHSPDESDAFVLAVHGMLHKSTHSVRAGAIR